MDPDDRLFGEIAIKLGFVQRAALGSLVKAIQARPGCLGEILEEAGLLDAAQLSTVRTHFDRIIRQRAQGTAVPPAEPPPAVLRQHSVPPPPQRATASRAISFPAPAAAGAGGRPFLDELLRTAVERGASDVHVHSGAPILLRIGGRLSPAFGETVLPAADAEKWIAELLPPLQWTRLAENGQADFAHAIPGVGRFRVNAYRQQRGTDVVFRVIPERRKTLAELGLPATLQRLLDFRTGLVLCTGPTGSGKSTTLAALLDALVESRKEHVITMEDPIEHVFRSTSSWVNQRQVESHTRSYARALRAALREDPDVIALTELRDRESIGLALTAAETGHLVLATVNTNSAGQTINRIVNAFPGEEQGHVRSMLSESLRAVISQRLIPTADGTGRIPAVEVLMGTTAVANTIRDNKTYQLPSLMQTGTNVGMVTLDDSLFGLVQAGKIEKAEAFKLATTKERFK
jgi:twitching motility protein PilT